MSGTKKHPIVGKIIKEVDTDTVLDSAGQRFEYVNAIRFTDGSSAVFAVYELEGDYGVEIVLVKAHRKARRRNR